ncbi:MAG: transglycosylase SLT domain-containing protein [Sandaracinaceae bacterium]
MRARFEVACGVALVLGCSGSAAPGGTTDRETSVSRRASSAGSDANDAPVDRDPAPSEPALDAETAALANAFEERLSVGTRRDGTRVLTPRCRNAPVDCSARLRAFARLIREVATAHEIDPLLLAAMALRESGLDPAALGRNREAGIVQLHPRGAGRGVRYVEDSAYRERCQSEVDACQREVLEVGVRTLTEGIERCGGLRAGLGAYASGHCTSSARYIDRVFEERDRLRALTER